MTHINHAHVYQLQEYKSGLEASFFRFNQICIMHRTTKGCGVISTPPPTLPTENSKLFNSQTAVKNCQNYH